MLIDAWMPEYDFAERHRALVRAPAPLAYRALGETDLAGHPIVRLLLSLRSLPALLLRRETPLLVRRAPGGLTLRDAPAFGFAILEEQAPREIVLGLTGRFWRLSGDLRPSDPRDFRGPVPPGMARVAWNFALAPAPAGGTLLSTETRIRCADPAARRAFGRYWLLIRPGSGLLRRVVLGRVKREAERRSASGGPA